MDKLRHVYVIEGRHRWKDGGEAAKKGWGPWHLIKAFDLKGVARAHMESYQTDYGVAEWQYRLTTFKEKR